MKHVALGLFLSCILVVAQSARGSEVALPAGTAVSVKLADRIDSEHDSFGKQYKAAITAPLQLTDGVTIPAGSHATIVLSRNNTGWFTKLTVLTFGGRQVEVAS